MPTTLLSQIDSSVGGKTAINLPSGKNLVGAFHQPACVVIDTETLMSLPSRELVSGFCEMVKQALIADKSLFDKTVDGLRQGVRNKRDFLLTSDFETCRSALRFSRRIVWATSGNRPVELTPSRAAF